MRSLLRLFIGEAEPLALVESPLFAIDMMNLWWLGYECGCDDACRHYIG
jgi:hypothetical protein